jgi:hypothetical protein
MCHSGRIGKAALLPCKTRFPAETVPSFMGRKGFSRMDEKRSSPELVAKNRQKNYDASRIRDTVHKIYFRGFRFFVKWEQRR